MLQGTRTIFQILFLCFVSLVVADQNAKIVNHQVIIDEDGSYVAE